MRFYQDLPGFSISDIVHQGGQPMAVFLHWITRHHSIAFLATSGAPKRINYFMLECNSRDDVGSGRDPCIGGAAPMAMELGRPMNDHMVSFYLRKPSQFAIEHGWGAREVDDTIWQVQRYDSVESLWGHPELLGLVTDAA